LPSNILAGDPKSGALASARTLDRPTELHMRNRQVLWETIIRNICMYVLRQSAQAFGGAVQGDVLNGVLELRPRRVQPADGQPRRRGRPRNEEMSTRQKVDVVVAFPPILERNHKENVGAVVDAATLAGRANKGTFSMSDIRRRLLKALGEADIDGAIRRIEEELEDPEEQPQEPEVNVRPGDDEDQSPLGRDIDPLTNNEDGNAPNARSGSGA